MTEKVIMLENISPVDFLGTENSNIKILSSAFPETKIISRGDEIRVKGASREIGRILEILDRLIEHYHKFGRIDRKDVQSYVDSEQPPSELLQEEGVIVYGHRGIVVKPKGTNQIKLVKAVSNNDLVFALGPAGTGKTYISVAMAVRALKNKEVKKIVITRPAVEAGENLGFLPGDLQEKIAPYLKPVYDALEDMLPPEKLRYYQENGIIEIAPLAYMRGRTLHHAFILLDEAQNTTPMQIKMFLTRMGPYSKVIVTGDQSQVDLPRNQKSGLAEALTVLRGVKGIGFVELQSKDVIRHKIVKRIIDAYGKFESESGA